MTLITITSALKIIQSGQPFTFQCVTYDRTRKKGGKIIEGEAKLLQKEEHPNPEFEFPHEPAARPMTETEEKISRLHSIGDGRKNPNHHLHFTRNIVLLANGHPVHPPIKIHPPLLIEFNGKTVVP